MTALILWENFAAASAAKDVCRALEESRHLPAWRDSMWKFDLLRLPALRVHVAAEAAAADLVIVAFESNTALPPELRHWLESWQAKATGKPQSLFALCIAPLTSDTDGGMLGALRAFARRVGCSFREMAGGASLDSANEQKGSIVPPLNNSQNPESA